MLEVELHPHEELAALGVGRVLVGADDVRARVGEEAGDGGDDAVAVGAGDEQAAVHAKRGGYFDQRVPRVLGERVAPAGREQRVDVAARAVALDRRAARGRGSRPRRSRGTSVTASPAAITPRLASGSRETIDEPHLEARRARTRGRSGCCRSARSSVPRPARPAARRRSAASGCPGGSATRNVSLQQVAPLDALVLAALAAPRPGTRARGAARRGRRARPARASAPPRAAPRRAARRPAARARRARSGTRRSAAAAARPARASCARGQLEALGDRVGVREQHLARRRQRDRRARGRAAARRPRAPAPRPAARPRAASATARAPRR